MASGSHSGWGQSGMSTVPMRVRGAQAMLSGQQGEQKWETNQEEREFSNSWTQHHCHIQPPVALQEPATPGLPLRLALGGAGLPLRLALGGGGKALNGQQRGLVSRERWEVELDFGGRSRST